MAHALLITLALLLLDAPWLCTTHSGKGDGTLVAGEARPLAWFAANLAAFDREIRWRVEHEEAWAKLTSEVVRRGRFGPYEVASILYRLPGSAAPFGKMVLLGAGSKFRPVLWTLADSEVTFAPVRMVVVAGTPVLVSRDRIDGTGNHHYEDYFTLDPTTQRPLRLDFEGAITGALTKVLPAGLAVAKGGGFDVAALRYTQAVSKPSDPNCCPTGGQVDIQLAIRAGAVAVVDARYTPGP